MLYEVITSAHLFPRHDAPAAGRPPEEALRENRQQAIRQLGPHLGLLGRGEDVDDPIHGRRRAVRVHRRHDEVAGLRRRQGDGETLEIPELPDHDDIGVLPEDMTKTVRERA